MASLGVLRFPRWGSSTYPEKYRLRAKHLLTQFGLNQQIQQKAKDLSGGQMQRVAIARAMLLEPLVILADEPIASLDPVAADEVMDHLKDLNANGTTVLVSLHQVAIAMKYAQRLVGLKNGRVIIDKKTSDLTKEEVLEIYRDLDE
jgi:phosphonate transport system ATP-binding protein